MPIMETIMGGLGLLKNFFGESQDRQNQMAAAKNSVQWRVKDAEKAGIHPLAALGMSPISISPSTIGDSGGYSPMGQSFHRAIAAGSTAGQRETALTKRLLEAQVTGAELDNDIRRAELASNVRRTLTGPGAIPAIPEAGPNTARGADFGGQVWPGIWETSKWPTAEEIERQYGDLIQNVYGTGRLAKDAYDNSPPIMPTVDRIDAAIKRVLTELFGINPAH